MHLNQDNNQVEKQQTFFLAEQRLMTHLAGFSQITTIYMFVSSEQVACSHGQISACAYFTHESSCSARKHFLFTQVFFASQY